MHDVYLHSFIESFHISLTISSSILLVFFFFFFNDTATTEIYTLSLHDALPILLQLALSLTVLTAGSLLLRRARELTAAASNRAASGERSEEHTSELQSPCNLVCRLLLEKKKKTNTYSCYNTSL